MFTTKHISDIAPKQFTIVRNGSKTTTMKPICHANTLTMAQAEQVLDQLQEELSAVGGDYQWLINDLGWDEDAKHKTYEFVARWCGKSWIEGRGNTPKEALLASYTFRRVANAMGWLKTSIFNSAKPELA